MIAALHSEIAACRICADALPHEPRPVVQFSIASRLLLIGQAPGSRVHASGIPWDDDSGDRLRDWLSIDKSVIYDAEKVALVPMGFCYPGKASGGDKPPRPECAPQWHERVLESLENVELTLLLGAHAQHHYLPDWRKLSMTERIQQWRDMPEGLIPLPHPAWRSAIWMRKNPWFESELLPKLQERVAHVIR